MSHDFSWRLGVLGEAPSTQDALRARAREGAPEGLCIHALRQTSGYGRHGRVWEGLEGNLFLSFLLRPVCDAEQATQMALVTGEALAGAMRGWLDEPGILTLKWPNDVLLQGQKCAGILIESELAPGGGGAVEWLAVGVGVNLKAAPQGPFSALSAHCARAPGVEEFRDVFLGVMAESYSRWQRDGFEAIRAQWQRGE
jgi:BirA family transcriptional regulator, biotin operon repressor / biotin---[acetyl-CoA-carboxylase] ligase